ncbi:MAG: ribonucleotide-diphosphate reductase subunit alpha, partial [Phycisphaerae bacterium]|nr:ribonucleotide-diphosphate reductase subunit alpha [Phycisphaerae bacterium]
MGKELFYWVTPETRTFMERGYLDEGQSVEERVREIAERAEEILGMEGFADEFQHCMSKGWFSLSTPVWVNFGKKKG